MLTRQTRIFTILFAVVVFGAAAIFYHAQNGPAPGIGGRISAAKAGWLGFVIYLWLFLSPAVGFDSHVAPSLRRVLLAFGAWMWLRSLVEVFLLYGLHAWRPRYGIGHDVSCLALIGVLLLVGRGSWSHAVRAADRQALALITLVLASVALEILYAALFASAVEGKTTGEAGLWFASELQPRFESINRLTARCNAVLFTALIAWLANAFKRPGAALPAGKP